MIREFSILFLVCGGLQAQFLPHATAEYGAFALPDESGRQLLVTEGVSNADALRHAICEGRSFPIRFLRRQEPSPGGNARQTAAQFRYLAGDVFQVIGRAVNAPAGCFLLAGGWSPVALRESGGGCAPALLDRIAAARKRAVVRCMRLARFGRGGNVVLAEFERLGADALAAVVVDDGGKILYADFTAKFQGPGEDLWRVDDGGNLTASDFRVTGLLRREDRYALAIAWVGSEGCNLTLFVSGDGGNFVRVLEEYWYQAPV